MKLTQRLRLKWQDYYKIFRSFENEQVLPGQSNIFIPKIWEIIEKKTPAVISHNPKFIVSPNQNEVIPYIKPLRDVLDAWWLIENMQLRMERWVKEGFVYGTSIGKIGWKQDVREVEKEIEGMNPDTGEPEMEMQTELEVMQENPTFETRSIFDVLTDPRVETFEESIAQIDIIDNVRLADLLRDAEVYDLSRLKKNKKEYAEGEDDSSTPDEKVQNLNDRGLDDYAKNIDKSTLTLKEYWGKFTKTDNPADEKEYVITTVWQDGVCIDTIRCEENPYGFRPFVKFDDHVVQGEFYGIGEVEPLEGLQIEYNNIRNARIDFNNSVIYPEWMYNLNASINPLNLVHKPNNLIPVEVPIGTDINTVLRTIEKPVTPQSGYAEEGQLNRDFQTISQTIDYTDRGGSKGFTSTATGIASRDAERSLQINNVVRHLEDAIAKIGTMWLRLASQFVEDEVVIRRKRESSDLEKEALEAPQEAIPSLEDVPEKFTRVSGDVFREIEENMTIRVEAGSTTAYSAVGKAQDAVNLGNLAAQFIGLGVAVDGDKVFIEILRDSFHKANPELYLKQQPPMQPGMEGVMGEGGPEMMGTPPAGGQGAAPGQASPPRPPMQPSQPDMTNSPPTI